MLKTFKHGFFVLGIYFRANGIWAFFDISNKIYMNTLYPLIQSLLIAHLIDILSKHQHITLLSIAWMAEIYIAATIIQGILFWLASINGARLEFALNDYLEFQINKKLNTLDPAVFENTKFQNLLAQMDGAKGSMSSYLVRMVNFIISASILISSSVVIASKFPIFIPIVIAANIPSFIASSRFRDNVWSYVGTQRGIVERLFTYIRTTFSNPSTSKEIAIFKNGPLLLGKFKKTHNQYYRSFDKANKDNLFMMILVTLIQNGALIFTQGINLMSVLTGSIAVGQFALYFQQTINLSEGTTGILDGYSSMSVRSKYVDSYFELLNFPNSISTSKVAEIVPTNPKPATIEFKNVFFKYPETERFILKDFNLVINPGEKIALVGENGAGKSTLIKLLLRFYDTNDGEILINGINIKNLDLNQWHKQIGALFQDFIKYQFTFKENIIFGNLEKKDDMKAIQDALKQSGAENYLADLPNGLEQIVGKTFDEGVDLSGGQWQKLALARAFFRDAPFLILDEPTSAIDAKAEFEIFENVQKLQKDKTVIIISHRFSTVRTADRILVLDEGKIIEEGSHEKLMKEKGVYAELFEIQAQGYK